MEAIDPQLMLVYRVLDLIGVVLNGMIGGTIARQRSFDVIGFAFLALFSALGGGMIRDTLMQKGTAAAIAEPLYLGMAILGALIALLIHLKGKAWELFKVHGDAIILGVWAVTGTMKALTFGMPWASAIFMGMLTACGGGMIRDIACGQIPSVFGGNSLYATPAIVGSGVMVIFWYLQLPGPGMIVATVVGAAFAIIAYWRGWVLPNDPEWAPVSMTARQLTKALRRARIQGEKAGVRRERKRHEHEQ